MNIILLVGKSGSGKTTLANYLANKYNWKSIESYTTRPQRCPQEQGHIFVNDQQFDQLKDLVAYTEYNGYRYCATSQQVEEAQIYVIDVAGVQYFKQHYKGHKKPIVIELNAPENILIQRMRERGDTEDSVNQRIINDRQAFRDIQEVKDYTIDATQSLDEISNIVVNLINER